MNQHVREDTGPWYRQPWPWIIIGFLGFAVFFSLNLVYEAYKHPDPLVVGDYYKAGLTINQDLSRDQEAHKLGLRADVRVNLKQGTIRIALTGKQKMSLPELRLQLLHPTISKHDVHMLLTPDAAGDFGGRLPHALPAGNWYVLIEPPNQAWRLHGRILLPATQQVDIGAG
ncbi:MAG: FixH family protein [Gammaproteobacteria bacterium]